MLEELAHVDGVSVSDVVRTLARQAYAKMVKPKKEGL